PKVASAKANATAGEPEMLKLAAARERILPISALAKSDVVNGAPSCAPMVPVSETGPTGLNCPFASLHFTSEVEMNVLLTQAFTIAT
ncbi:MAG TPA: hypothetical protein VFO40_10155, partial [Chthoniobacterales bacterium]|nr:hypothetical protein [Chthoniobacterales bacterium]